MARALWEQSVETLNDTELYERIMLVLQLRVSFMPKGAKQTAMKVLFKGEQLTLSANVARHSSTSENPAQKRERIRRVRRDRHAEHAQRVLAEVNPVTLPAKDRAAIAALFAKAADDAAAAAAAECRDEDERR